MSENNLLTTKQAAEKLGVSVRRVQALITNGKLKAQKIGRDYMIDASTLDSLKKGKAGRPTKLPKDLEDMNWEMIGASASRRTMRNYNFEQRAAVILDEHGFENFMFLYDETNDHKRLGSRHYKKTIISELGRIKYKDILLDAAKKICEHKPTTAKAVKWIRDVRKEYGSFDEVWKPTSDGKFEVFSTDNE